ncbi:MAG: exodeoxyribonuclease III [Polyangiaceae bacterium]
MKIVTWNVNSIRARLGQVLEWMNRTQPDVVCMQETKVEDSDFPTEEFQRIGYGIAISGQKTYNGVAIATSRVLMDVQAGLLDAAPEDDKRLLAVTIKGVRIYSAYVPNGKGVEHPDFEKKKRWLADFKRTVADDIARGRAKKGVVLCGDYNIAPEERDVYDVEAMRGQLHFHPDEHAALQDLLSLGLVDAFRLHNQEGGLYSWWDYRAGMFRRNLGLRIDLILLSEQLKERCTAAHIDKTVRKQAKPSDHAPVVVELDL